MGVLGILFKLEAYQGFALTVGQKLVLTCKSFSHVIINGEFNQQKRPLVVNRIVNIGIASEKGGQFFLPCS